MNGKGDNARPLSVSRRVFGERWRRTFARRYPTPAECFVGPSATFDRLFREHYQTKCDEDLDECRRLLTQERP